MIEDDEMDNYFDEEDDRPLCFRCDGAGEVSCHCGGDQCYCGAEDIPCPACRGEGHVSQEKYDRQIAGHREMMKAIWGDGWDRK